MGKNPAQKAKAQTTDKSGKVEGRASKKKVVKKKKKVVVEAASAKRSDRPCKVQNCKGGYRAKGYCRRHYKEWRTGKFGRARYKLCKDNGCNKPMTMNRHGYCEDHFQNYYVKGMEVAKAAPDAKKEETPKEAASA